MQKDLKYAQLLDIYGRLLTDKQKEAMEYYYDSDYSLGEISELMDISRQGVRDFIKRGEAIIDETESKLCLMEKYRAVVQILEATESIVDINKRIYQNKTIADLTEKIVNLVDVIESEA